MGEHEMTVLPCSGAGWESGLIQLPGRQNDLLGCRLIRTQWIAINDGVIEVVVNPQLLELTIGLQ